VKDRKRPLKGSRGEPMERLTKNCSDGVELKSWGLFICWEGSGGGSRVYGALDTAKGEILSRDDGTLLSRPKEGESPFP